MDDTALAGWVARNLAYLAGACTDLPWTDATSERTGTMSPVGAENWRDSDIGLRGDPADIARVTAAATAAGVAPSRWAGDALADALEDQTGWSDGTRRNSPRSPNRQPRKDRQGDRHLSRLAIRVSAEEKRRITALATGQGMTITEWAWAAIEATLSQAAGD